MAVLPSLCQTSMWGDNSEVQIQNTPSSGTSTNYNPFAAVKTRYHVSSHCNQHAVLNFREPAPYLNIYPPIMLTPTYPVRKYAPWPPRVNASVCHWGQIKLFISEIQFLSRMLPTLDTPTTVVYAGAAAGFHIPALACLFPSVTFELYDPAPFGRNVYQNEVSHRLHIHQRLFTDHDALEQRAAATAAGVQLLLISDIRSSIREENVAFDMKLQHTWYRLLQADGALMKFRLPWNNDTAVYLEGEAYFPIFGLRSTTEFRLLVPGNAADVRWDCRRYEDQCQYFNRTARTAHYTSPLKDTAAGQRLRLCDCFDCAALGQAVLQYVCKYGITEQRLSDQLIPIQGQIGTSAPTTIQWDEAVAAGIVSPFYVEAEEEAKRKSLEWLALHQDQDNVAAARAHADVEELDKGDDNVPSADNYPSAQSVPMSAINPLPEILSPEALRAAELTLDVVCKAVNPHRTFAQIRRQVASEN